MGVWALIGLLGVGTLSHNGSGTGLVIASVLALYHAALGFANTEIRYLAGSDGRSGSSDGGPEPTGPSGDSLHDATGPPQQSGRPTPPPSGDSMSPAGNYPRSAKRPDGNQQAGGTSRGQPHSRGQPADGSQYHPANPLAQQQSNPPDTDDPESPADEEGLDSDGDERDRTSDSSVNEERRTRESEAEGPNQDE